jgi:hypothetical protein
VWCRRCRRGMDTALPEAAVDAYTAVYTASRSV